MSETRRYALGNQLDIQQILVEAQHRWLRPAEIVEILSNHERFDIAHEPPNKPPSGSLFLFNRKVLRYFRKDSHNWRKKRDGKTVKEAHERLKSGSVDVLQCYYAHGEENDSFQRRTYWMLEEELSHIVLVHYREVKGTKTNFNIVKGNESAISQSQDFEDSMPNSEMDTSLSSNSHPRSYQVLSQTMDTTSMNSAHTPEYEDAESAYNNQASSSFHSFLKGQQPAMEKIDAYRPGPYNPLLVSSDFPGKVPAVSGDFIQLALDANANYAKGPGVEYNSHKNLDLQSWEEVNKNSTLEVDDMLGQLLGNYTGRRPEYKSHLQLPEEWQVFEGASSQLSTQEYDLSTRFDEQQPVSGNLINTLEAIPVHHQGTTAEGKPSLSSSMKQHLLDGSSVDYLKKNDSFTRWMSKELEDVNEPSGSRGYWDSTFESENGVDDASDPSQVHLDTYTLAPSLSQEQLYSIIDFSPNWVHVGTKVKVLVTGRFLKSQEAAEKCKWACMFGEVEVPAEILGNGVLRCSTPPHEVGRVPFYITCSNRVACSEVYEFEYRPSDLGDVDFADNYNGNTIEDLHIRFGKLLRTNSEVTQLTDPSISGEVSRIVNKINSLLKEDDLGWDQMFKLTSDAGSSAEQGNEQVQKLLKEQLRVWLLHKVVEGGKGPRVLDEGGQGVLHFAAALGYDWAFEPTIVAGVSVNFRDMNGWTALHWAASCGRERTVALLINLGAATGAVTDPTPTYPRGRAPADLAASNGHKGIAGYLAESALSAQVTSLALDKQNGDRIGSSEHGAPSVSEGGSSDGLSMHDSLAAVRNATQNAARIFQVFRVESFQRKQLKEQNNDKFGMSDEHVLSLITVKKNKPGQHDGPVQAAAIRIQNKFRSWKGRKDYLIIRQQIIKIQAHVRGHQVRKNYRKIVWSVGIVEKLILRWRRKGSGLRGFKSEARTEGPSTQGKTSNEDDYDFFKDSRKQTEERSQVALARVKSMLQYPEAREQYRRLRNVVNEIQETKYSQAVAEFDDLIDLEELLDDDLFMSPR